MAKRHVDNLSNLLQQERVNAGVRGLEGIDRQPQARGNDGDSVPGYNGVGGVPALDAVVVVGGLGEARRVVRAAQVHGHLEDLVQAEEPRLARLLSFTMS